MINHFRIRYISTSANGLVVRSQIVEAKDLPDAIEKVKSEFLVIIEIVSVELIGGCGVNPMIRDT